MAWAKGEPRQEPFTTHGDTEILLIRTGHRLWAQYQDARNNHRSTRETDALLAACESVWQAKRKYRAELPRLDPEERRRIKAEMMSKTQQRRKASAAPGEPGVPVKKQQPEFDFLDE